ncbi:MAG: AMP-binding protein [Deltaproteobacteria bacterium]|nr:AMP-binding protein [Deltaproteobacteria bacterium]
MNRKVTFPTRNFVCLLEDTAARFPEKPALVCPDETLSYRVLHERAAGFARELADRGVRPGDRVALVLPNHWSFAAAMLGIWKLGATAVPLSPLLKSEERDAILADVDAALVVERLAARTGVWSTVPEGVAPAHFGYSSGSTGRPKGAVFTHAALTFANHSWADMMAVVPEDVVLSVLPLPHSFGLNGSLLAPLLRGATVVLPGGFAPDEVLAAMQEHRVTLFLGVATMFRRLLSTPEFAGADLSSLRLSVSGAAPCPWDLASEWRRRAGHRILRGYGMTELFRPISYLASEPEDRPECIGRAVPGVEVRVVADAGAESGDGDTGELRIRTPAALQGYWNDPAPVLEDGWFRTGDLARISSGGFVEITGRLRERILRGGYSVFPEEVEAVLAEHPDVAEAAVIGVPHPELGEEVAAFVVVKPGAGPGTDTLAAYCADRLARFKYPRHIRLVSELPKGATGKVVKAELLRRWRATTSSSDRPGRTGSP